MALIDETTRFNADELDSYVVGIAARVGKHDSGMHSHAKAQLLYAPQGCMSIQLQGRKSVLPPTRAAWIPAGVKHCAIMNNVVEYRSLYFDLTVAPQIDQVSRIDQIKIVEVTPLLQALIERMSFWEWNKPESEMTNTLALFIEELNQSTEQLLSLPIPSDPRLSGWIDSLNQPTSIVPALNQLANHIGASSKTISRIFTRETGMPYQSWRQQWRLLRSIELLSQGLQVNDVAYQLEFSSDSAFITFFKQQTGATPLQYLHSSA
ncbi:AraC family transcriptional regulator [Vibrio aquaticus]|uniref:AraC family transcriptional regulator n=1 Tax=Vibrio aquaticus TaxID=2496559 RepID=A0A432D266_9VIBR|nr:helix-turn-helix transcriptional regulator [Vibrio aquaticus]RTZ18012.1 AraC family transcriptional regulator [Vibrio aquaticus]